MNAPGAVQPHERIAGVDEAGRGPLAGPVVVAAVIPMVLVGVLLPEGSTRDTLIRIAPLGGVALVPLGFIWKQRRERKRRGY